MNKGNMSIHIKWTKDVSSKHRCKIPWRKAVTGSNMQTAWWSQMSSRARATWGISRSIHPSRRICSKKNCSKVKSGPPTQHTSHGSKRHQLKLHHRGPRLWRICIRNRPSHSTSNLNTDKRWCRDLSLEEFENSSLNLILYENYFIS